MLMMCLISIALNGPQKPARMARKIKIAAINFYIASKNAR
jgi:hypothetical protein